jgi:thioredoxin 1
MESLPQLLERNALNNVWPNLMRSSSEQGFELSFARIKEQSRLVNSKHSFPSDMAMNDVYATIEPSRAEIDLLDEPIVIEFGTPWCGYCRAAQPHVAAALADHPRVRHIKIADASGRPLGRSFAVKLWPTLVFLSHGKEAARVVRPANSNVIRQALAQIDRDL